MSILNFIIIYTILTISIIGYGFLFSIKFTKYNSIILNKISIGFIGIFGIFFSIFISYITNFVFPHNNLHNLIFIFFGVLFFVIFIKKYRTKIYLKYFLFSFFIYLIAIFFFKSHDDFSYYHLSFISNLTQNKIEFGIGHFDVAFNHNSSLFYFHSLFKTFLTGDYFYQIGQASFVIFVNTILLENIFNNKKMTKLNISFFLSLFLLVFINIFFYRLAEHGTDRSAQILFFLAFILTVKIFENKKNFEEIFELLLILFTLIVTIKSFYILYSILIIYLYFRFTPNYNFLYLFKKFPVILICVSTFLMMIVYNISQSGCLMYPISASCPDNFFWSYGFEKVSNYRTWYELWSKAGATPNYIIENKDHYLAGLNWVPNWFDNYFFNKFSDYLLGILLTMIIFIISFKTKYFNFKNFENYKYLYLILILLFLEWFLQHPALRYGGYVLVFLIITFPLAILLSVQNYNYSQKSKSIKTIILIIFTVFILRNTDRLIMENEVYGYNIFKNINYNIQSSFYNMQNIKNKIFKNPNICNENNSLTNIKCKKISNYNFYFEKK